MTISSLLGRGVSPVGRFQMSGPGAMGDTEIFHHVDRGSYGPPSHGGGGKGGGKGSQSALSALTLLAFLFFINLLQSCLKDSMMMNGTAMLMMMPAANRSARHTRSLEGGLEPDENEVDAMPGPGVHWDSNVLLRQKGDAGNDDFVMDQTSSNIDQMSYTNGDGLEHPLWNEQLQDDNIDDVDYDYQEEISNKNISSVSQSKEGYSSSKNVKFLQTDSSQEWQNQQENPIYKPKTIEDSSKFQTYAPNSNLLLHKEVEFPQEWLNQQENPIAKSRRVEDSTKFDTSTQNSNTVIHKELELYQELPNQQESPIAKSRRVEDTKTSTQNTNTDFHEELNSHKWSNELENQNNYETPVINGNSKDDGYYKYNLNPEIAESIDDWDDYDDRYETTVESDDFFTRGFSTSNPTADGFVRDRYEAEDYEDGSLSTSIGEYVYRVVSSVSYPLMERFQSSVNIAQCSELVVCEAHRLGRAWGTPGLLLASGFSEVMLWMYGSDNDHRKVIMEAAATGRQRHSCRVQMQQCEDKSKDRSALPLMATVLEQLV